MCGEATTPKECLDLLGEVECDLVIVDLVLRQGSGLELVKTVRCQFPRTRVLVCSVHDETLFAERCLRAGASGYVQKQEEAAEVLKAVRRVLAGHVHLSRSMADHVLTSAAGSRGEGGLESLSDRELEVFGLIGQALGTREIAEHLHLSPKTVESHRENIKRKLGLANSNQLVQHAVVWLLSETGVPPSLDRSPDRSS